MKNKQNHKGGPVGSFIAVAIIFAGLITFLFIDFRGKRIQNNNVQDEKTSSELVTLNYYTWDEEEAYMSAMIESFNAQHPNIEIRLHVLVSDDYDNAIIDLILNGENIDIIGIRGIAQMARYQKAGMLLNITDRVLSSPMDITTYGNMYNNILIGGKYYGMPTRSTCWALVYNKDIFDERKEPYPEQLTWEEYADLAKRLTYTNSKGEKVYGGYVVTWALNFAGIQQSNYLFDDDQSGQRKSLELLNQFMNIDQSHIDMKRIEQNEYWLTMFEQGEVAMMPMGEWIVGMIMEDERQGRSSVDWDLAPMPVFEGMNPGTTWGQYQFTGITRFCKNRDAAFAFLEYAGGVEGAKIYSEYGMLSAYNTEETREIYRRAVGNKNVDVFFDAFRIQEIPVFDEYEDINQLFVNLGKEYLKGNATLDETMEEFDRGRIKLIQKK